MVLVKELDWMMHINLTFDIDKCQEINEERPKQAIGGRMGGRADVGASGAANAAR